MIMVVLTAQTRRWPRLDWERLASYFIPFNNGHIFLFLLSKQILRYNFEENMFKDKKARKLFKESTEIFFYGL